MDPLFDLTGKVAVITGSSRGIGKAIGEVMARHGAKVVISSRKTEACEQVAQGIRSAGGEAIAIACNISHKEQLQQLVDKTVDHWGKIDILVCNAAVNPFFGTTQDIPDDAFDKIIHCNIRSNHWLCQMVIPQMAERRDGVVIIVSSIGGLRGNQLLGTYGVTKAADMQLARNLATEWGPNNIRVNCIAPGLIRTDFARALWENDEILRASTRGSALRRIGEPEEIAGAAIFLASRAGGFTTGSTIVIDGGATIYGG